MRRTARRLWLCHDAARVVTDMPHFSSCKACSGRCQCVKRLFRNSGNQWLGVCIEAQLEDMRNESDLACNLLVYHETDGRITCLNVSLEAQTQFQRLIDSALASLRKAKSSYAKSKENCCSIHQHELETVTRQQRYAAAYVSSKSIPESKQ